MCATNIEQVQHQNKLRHDWLDVMRGLGIVLVFYGHYIQRGIDAANSSATEQFS